MKIAVVRPSEDFPVPAGVRIRYLRLRTYLEEQGHSLDFIPIKSISNCDDLAHDVFIFSKCQDARSLSLAHAVKVFGKRCGVDLFDDYFSQIDESRLIRRREWLRNFQIYLDFALCSTPRMKAVLQNYNDVLPVHVLNDPFDEFDPSELEQLLLQKLIISSETRSLRVAWFGVGTNERFPVGLFDLAAFGRTLHSLNRNGQISVSLDIATNAAALDTKAFEMLKTLSVPYSVRLWSESEERALLRSTLASFIPVNAQLFSIAKSLNRAVTALVSGTQVISPGYPLYAPLAPFIYDDFDSFSEDYKTGKLKLRQETVGEFIKITTALADPIEEAKQLVNFLSDMLRQPTQPRQSKQILVHGWRTSPAINEYAQRVGSITIATPFSSPDLHADARFDFDDKDRKLRFHLNARAYASAAAKWRSATRSTRKMDRYLYEFDLSLFRSSPFADKLHLIKIGHPAIRLVMYNPLMQMFQTILKQVYPEADMILSENEGPFAIWPHREYLGKADC